MNQPTYQYYNQLFKDLHLPLAYVDMNMLNQNINDIATRANKTNIRIASKSLRCTHILKHILESNAIYNGIMCFTTQEAIWLSQQGFDNLLLGYPSVNKDEIQTICQLTKQGKKIILMVDSIVHLELVNQIAKAENTIQPLCIDLDMSSDFPGLHFGVMRSPLNTVDKAIQVIDAFDKFQNISLNGLMGYEAQIAGLGDNSPHNGIKNPVIKLLKKKSIKEIAKRRGDVVNYIKSKNHNLEIVNAGGTGSIESSIQEPWVTEVTVGSGFYTPALFDYYSNFKHLPAAGYAVQIVRKPAPNHYTCLGGGYVASGPVGADKRPIPYLPLGIQLTDNEETGEVQTPCIYKGNEKLNIGDTILFRHAKAGELCERFNELHLIKDGQIINKVPTYRGEGKCFL
ncbi:MAG: amino acid deaminase/aldolase [Chitinophagales bacterium]|nr:amino acid deaminase/aldolase [Chitinophagales bacterium]